MTPTTHLPHTEPAPRPHPIRARGNARFFDLMDWYLHRRLGPRKQALFADLPAVVVELGAGAGASMRYLQPGTRLIAVEPNPFSHDALRRNARRYGIDLEIRAELAESTGLVTASVDAVICTLVLCTVEDEAVALRLRRMPPRPRHSSRDHRKRLLRSADRDVPTRRRLHPGVAADQRRRDRVTRERSMVEMEGLIWRDADRG